MPTKNAKPVGNPPRRQRSGDKREALVAAAREVVARDGIAGASVRAVAAQAEVSVGTVLYHFEGGLEELQQLALERVMEQLYAGRLKILAGPGSVVAKLSAMVELGVPDEIDEDLASVYFTLPQLRENPLRAAAHRELVERQVSLYRSLIEIGVELGEFRAEEVEAAGGADDVARTVVALEDANDLYPLLGLEAGGGAARRRRVRRYLSLALGAQIAGQ
ncbi:MAG: TetR family transcriptional regulator [Arthrobacter sp.]|nr:TetR family transcriptional regulator [Arthrobacter sp.]